MKNNRRMILAIISIVIAWIAPLQATTLSLKDSVFSSLQLLKDIDTITIESCTFENMSGPALIIEKAKSVNISNCIFRNITLRNNEDSLGVLSGTGIASLQLLNCEFSNIAGTAIRFPIGTTTTVEDRNFMFIMSGCRMNGIKTLQNVKGNGVMVSHSNYAFIVGNRFRNIENDAITLGSIDAQTVDMGNVQGNRIDSVLGNGIVILESAIKPWIKDNIIFWIAYDGKGANPNAAEHGISNRAIGSLIQNNAVLYNHDGREIGKNGNGIYSACNAIIEQNTIGYCTGYGIEYSGNAESKGALTIQNNVIFENDRNGVFVNTSGLSVRSPDSIMILHNTIMNHKVQSLMQESCPIAIDSCNAPVTIAGNYSIYQDQFNPLEHIRILNASLQPRILYNLNASNTNDFVDATIGDFKLLQHSIAINYAKHGIPIILDREGRFRSGVPDAGAFEFMSPASIREDIMGFITAMNQITMREERNVKVCALYSLEGEQVACSFTQDQSTLSISISESLPAGVYLCRVTYAGEQIREFPLIHNP
jgi:hypothetical protein